VAQLHGPGQARDDALHTARKADKQVRYMSEILIPVIGEPARRLRRQPKDFKTCSATTKTRWLPARCSTGSARPRTPTGTPPSPTPCSTPSNKHRVLLKLPNCVARLHDDRTLSWLPKQHLGMRPAGVSTG
jgi:hypothetical protein